ncbi:MAG: hypothetical protein PHS34_02920 [Candidatus Omnitrophica bacterium]|nr:hypothetical protein [Candidatus Omnitrophota bacterium]
MKKIVIVLTTDCNFSCDYCYAKTRRIAMPNEVVIKIIDNLVLLNNGEKKNS